MNALRTQYVNLTSHADNADGTLTVTAIARRSGTMRYRSDSGDRVEFVPPELIDARDDQGRPVMGMLAGAPNTNEHPAQIIRYSTDSRKAVQVGKVKEEIHIFNDADGERSVKVRFDVSDPETIADIKSGRKKGVSLGYLCNVVREDGEYKGTPYTHRQAMPFSIDHLAIVANPRNPGALITRFDSDDIGVAVEETRSSFEVIRVDACCSGCEGDSGDEPDDPKTKKEKAKTDAEDLPMIAVTFADRIHELSIPQAQALWEDGTIDRVRMDGEDYFMAADVALVLAYQGLIHEDAFVAKAGIAKGGGMCGRGWVGVKGSCKRMTKGADRAGAQKAALGEFAAKQREGKTFAKTSKVPTVVAEPNVKTRKARSKKTPTATSKVLAKPAENAKNAPNPEAKTEEIRNGPIKSQAAFSTAALKAAKQLDEDYNMDNLIPIHKLREAIGDKVSRSEFSDWLKEMNANDKIDLVGGEMPSLTPEIASNSIKTALGAPRYYLKIKK